MKITRYIILSVVVLAAISIFLWKGNVSFLSSSILQDAPLTTHSQYLRLQLPPGIGQEKYTREVLEAVIKKQDPWCTDIALDTSVSENILQVAFTCQNTLVTTEFIPDTTFIPETTFETISVNIAEEIITAVAPTSIE